LTEEVPLPFQEFTDPLRLSQALRDLRTGRRDSLLLRATDGRLFRLTPEQPLLPGNNGSLPDVPKEDEPEPCPLTPRQIELLSLVKEGMDNGQIARKLFMSEETVKSHLRHILARLDVNTRLRAVVISMEQEWI
jgi:DNA-binding NarL/FixJ family response regulator